MDKNYSNKRKKIPILGLCVWRHPSLITRLQEIKQQFIHHQEKQEIKQQLINDHEKQEYDHVTIDITTYQTNSSNLCIKQYMSQFG